MRAGKRVGLYLEMVHWEVYSNEEQRWQPWKTRPAHVIHAGCTFTAHGEDLLGMFGNKVSVVAAEQVSVLAAQQDHTSEAPTIPCADLTHVKTPPTPPPPWKRYE